MKTCSRCKELKGASDFAVYNGKLWCWCRACQRAASVSYRARNREKVRASAKEYGIRNRDRRMELCREWRAKNRTRHLEGCRRRDALRRAADPEYDRRRNFRQKYKITIEQYDAMYRDQNGVCAICARLNLSGRRLAVDHDHDTGKIRGLLCSRCNSAIGLARESLDVLKMTVVYLEKHKSLSEAVIL